MLQWMQGPIDPAGTPPPQPDYIVNWPIPFPNGCLMPFVTLQAIGSPELKIDTWYIVYNYNQTGVRVQRQSDISGQSQCLLPTRANIVGIGF